MKNTFPKRAPGWVLAAMALAAMAMFAPPATMAKTGKDEILIFAASSLAPPLEEIAAGYQQQGGGKLRFAFASSAVLARQIEYGAPADLFITAHRTWLKKLEITGRIDMAAPRAIAGNRLVLARQTGSADNEADFRTLLLAPDTGRIATGDPHSVPLGMYARDSLTALGLWPAVARRLAPAANARAALLQVERGLAGLGILYASDVAGSRRAVIVAEMPAHSYAPIRYLAVPVGDRGGRPEVGEVLALLESAESGQIFCRHGFTPAD